MRKACPVYKVGQGEVHNAHIGKSSEQYDPQIKTMVKNSQSWGGDRCQAYKIDLVVLLS